MTHRISLAPSFNSMGFAGGNQPPYNYYGFARRRVKTVENIVTAKYNFNNMMGITFRARHYYSSVKNKEFYQLEQETGILIPDGSFTGNIDRNVNFFNVDMVYTWQFAPGSFINVVWKNAIFDYTNVVEKNYFKNFTNTMEADQNNNISLKVIYFLDYLQLKKKKKN